MSLASPVSEVVSTHISVDSARNLLGKIVRWESEYWESMGLPQIGVFVGFWNGIGGPRDYPGEFYDTLPFPFYINVDGLIIHASNISPVEAL